MNQPDPVTIELNNGYVMECGMFIINHTDENIYNMFIKKHLAFVNIFSEIVNVQCQLGGTTFNQTTHSLHTTDFFYDGAGCNLYLRFETIPTDGLCSGFYQVVGKL
jgi:hypothetical protein